jgi:hypothetical protein
METLRIVVAAAALASVSPGAPARAAGDGCSLGLAQALGAEGATGIGCLVEEAKITPSGGGPSEHFGFTVSLSGDTALVGAWGDDDKGANAGAAYVFVKSGAGWSEQAKLLALDGGTYDFLGHSVSLSGDTALVGAYGDDSGTNGGSAYVFVRTGTTWTQEAKIRASDSGVTGLFGHSVTLSGDVALVGASDSAYVFVRSGTTWTEEAKLLASGTANVSALSTSSVALAGDTALVGTPRDGGGSVHVFVRSGTSWSEEAELVGSDTAQGDDFGFSVSISGDTLLVGARRDDDAGPQSGSAYVFERNATTWTERAKLLASDAAQGAFFGASVSVSGDSALVGSFKTDDDGSQSGSAYLFVRTGTTWTEETKLTAGDASEDDWFGEAVFLDGGSALIGASGDEVVGLL